jgi:hypothetical protein
MRFHSRVEFGKVFSMISLSVKPAVPGQDFCQRGSNDIPPQLDFFWEFFF